MTGWGVSGAGGPTRVEPPPDGRRRELQVALAITLVLALLQDAAGRTPIPLLDGRALYDALMRMRAALVEPEGGQTLIVRFDDETCRALRTPWSARFLAHHERVLERILAGGPKAVGFDLGLGFLEESSEGRRFLSAVAAARRVVLASTLEPGERSLLPAGVLAATSQVPVPTGFAEFNLPSSDPPPLRADGVVRAVDPVRPDPGSPTPSFALRVALTGLGLTAGDVEVSDRVLRVGERRVSISGRALWVDFRLPGGIPSVRYENVLDGKVSGRTFRDRYVLIGSTSRTLRDEQVTAVGQMPGVEVHAAILQGLLSGRGVVPAPSWVGLIVLVLAGALAGIAARHVAPFELLSISLGLSGTVALALVGAMCAGVFVCAPAALLAPPLAALALAALASRRAGRAPARVLAALEPTEQVSLDSLARAPGVGLGAGPGGDLAVTLAASALDARYRDVRLLGKGGMGVVLAAHDTVRDEPVAIKVLSPMVSDSQELTLRFLREIRTLSELAHPRIVRILDIATEARFPYYVMGLVKGVPLSEVLAREGPLDLGRAAPLIEQVLEVLAFIHGRGIVHRDIKPENILVDAAGLATVLDFGLAHLPNATTLTHDGQILGTLKYMSPEQFDGLPPGPATDVFSAGLVGYHLLAGTPPFPDAGRILNLAAQPVPITRSRPGLPPDLDGFFERCLARVPSERFQDGAQALAAWRQALAGPAR